MDRTKLPCASPYETPFGGGLIAQLSQLLPGFQSVYGETSSWQW